MCLLARAGFLVALSYIWVLYDRARDEGTIVTASYLTPTAKIEMKMLTLYVKMRELLPHVEFPDFSPKYTQLLSRDAAGFRSVEICVVILRDLLCAEVTKRGSIHLFVHWQCSNLYLHIQHKICNLVLSLFYFRSKTVRSILSKITTKFTWTVEQIRELPVDQLCTVLQQVCFYLFQLLVQKTNPGIRL